MICLEAMNNIWDNSFQTHLFSLAIWKDIEVQNRTENTVKHLAVFTRRIVC